MGWPYRTAKTFRRSVAWSWNNFSYPFWEKISIGQGTGGDVSSLGSSGYPAFYPPPYPYPLCDGGADNQRERTPGWSLIVGVPSLCPESPEDPKGGTARWHRWFIQVFSSLNQFRIQIGLRTISKTKSIDFHQISGHWKLTFPMWQYL